MQCAENAKFLVRASYLEIYNEDVRDLLGADTKQKLEVRRSQFVLGRALISSDKCHCECLIEVQ